MNSENISIMAIQIGFLGDTTVGKTAICNSFLNSEFNDDIIGNIDSEKLETQYTLEDGNKVKLILMDTAGHERFRSVVLNSMRTVQGIVIVFDLTYKKTFEKY